MIADEEEGFEIQGFGENFIRLSWTKVYGFPNFPSHFGGYEVQATIKIVAGDFQVLSTFFTSTGELHGLYEQLKSCNERVEGAVRFASYEENLMLEAAYHLQGRVSISGRYRAGNQSDNELHFGIDTDQSYLQETVQQLSRLANKYGGMRGVNG